MIRAIALVLTVLTGFAGLVYEVTWQKYLAALLGSHAEATAAVLAIFLGGLAAGYALFGWATRRLVLRAQRRGRPPRLLYFYALVEGGIGLYALAFPALFGLAQSLSLLGPADAEGLGFAFDVGLSALLIGPPAVLMGGTIPILTLALAGDLGHATRIHAWVYGFNTLGAFAGALAAGFVLIPRLGLDGTLYTLACVNLVAAAIFAQLDRSAARIAPDWAERPVERALPGFAAWAAVALLAGFAMMALQTTFNRLGALAFGSSEFTFSMVVAVFVLCIAIGSLAVSALPRIPRGLVVVSQWLLVALLFLLYIAIADVTYWAHVLRVLFGQVDAAFYLYQAVVLQALLVALLLPIGLSGALLPLLFDQLRREVRDLGSMAGRLYAWNTLGSLLGALLGGYLLLIWLDLHQVYRIAMACLAVGAALLTALVLRRRSRSVAAIVLVPTLVGIALLPPWPPERLTAGLFRWRQPSPATFQGPEAFFGGRTGEVIFYDDDPTSTVSVFVPAQGPENQSIVVNGKSDGALQGDYPTMALSALLPALMAEHDDRAFVIGLGTGVTTGELAALENTREIRVAEISRGVIEANPLFDAGNLAASKSPKVEIRRGDAYRTLLRSRGRYDLIVSEPSNPWVTGVEMLYSQEFLQAARSHLAPGGVYAQWFHLYETDTDVVKLVLRTYASVFPHVSVWFALGSDLILLGFDHPDRALDVPALEERFRRPDFAAGFARVGITSFPQLLAHELIPIGVLHAEPLPGEIHSLSHPILSHRAARAFFRGSSAWLPTYVSEAQQEVASRNSLLRHLAAPNGSFPEDVLEAAATETCRFHRSGECATFFARWTYDHPRSPRLRAALSKVRERNGRSPQLDARRLAMLRPLFAGKAPPARGGASSVLAASRLTNRFLSYYSHAAPFDRRALEAAWARCRGPHCAEARLQAESRIGALDGEAEAPGRARVPGQQAPGTGSEATTYGDGE